MLKLLCRTIGFTFYQQHAGLFLVVFYLLFGAVEGSQLISYHTALLLAICSSPMVLMLVFAIWVLYAFKCALFVRRELKKESYGFTKNLTVLGKSRQLLLWTKVYTLLLLPILGYAAFLLLIALKHGFYFAFVAVTLQLLLLFFLLSLYTFQIHNYTFTVRKDWITLPNFNVKRPFWAWPLFYLLNEQLLMLLLCKLVSFVFLKGMLWMFADVGPDIRVYLTAAMAVVLSHAVLLFNLVKFEAAYLAFAKGLPISTLKKMLQWLGIVALLVLPEMTMFAQLLHFELGNSLVVLFYLASGMLCLLTLVYWLKANMDSYLKYLLFFFFTNMWAILAAQYLLLSLLMLSLACLGFLWKYNRIDLREIA